MTLSLHILRMNMLGWNTTTLSSYTLLKMPGFVSLQIKKKAFPLKINASNNHQISFADHNFFAINCISFQGNVGKMQPFVVSRALSSYRTTRKPFECKYEHLFKRVYYHYIFKKVPAPPPLKYNGTSLIVCNSTYYFQWPIILANCWLYSLYLAFCHESMRLWNVTAANYNTAGVLFGLIDYEYITDSYGFKYRRIEIVTH